jgi:hypothetical protein
MSLRSGVSHHSSLVSSHHTGTVDDTAILKQDYVYPGDQRVVPPSRRSSLRRTISLTNLDEALAPAVSRARDARPGLGLITSVVLGGSPVTISSGSILRADVVVTPPGVKGSDASRSWGSGSVASFDDTFFSDGSTVELPVTAHGQIHLLSTRQLLLPQQGRVWVVEHLLVRGQCQPSVLVNPIPRSYHCRHLVRVRILHQCLRILMAR